MGVARRNFSARCKNIFVFFALCALNTVTLHPTQQTTQRQQLIEVATHAPCCGTQGKTRVSVEAGDPSVSEFRGFAVTRPANDGCTGMIASTAVSTRRRSVCTRWLLRPARAKKAVATWGETNTSHSNEWHHISGGNLESSPGR